MSLKLHRDISKERKAILIYAHDLFAQKYPELLSQDVYVIEAKLPSGINGHLETRYSTITADRIRVNKLIIRLDRNVSNSRLLETAFHELTHAYQWITGMTVRWNAHLAPPDDTLVDHETYFNYPWEVHARNTAADLINSVKQNRAGTVPEIVKHSVLPWHKKLLNFITKWVKN